METNQKGPELVRSIIPLWIIRFAKKSHRREKLPKVETATRVVKCQKNDGNCAKFGLAGFKVRYISSRKVHFFTFLHPTHQPTFLPLPPFCLTTKKKILYKIMQFALLSALSLALATSAATVVCHCFFFLSFFHRFVLTFFKIYLDCTSRWWSHFHRRSFPIYPFQYHRCERYSCHLQIRWKVRSNHKTSSLRVSWCSMFIFTHVSQSRKSLRHPINLC